MKILCLLLIIPALAYSAEDPFFSQQWSLFNDGSQTISINVDDFRSLQQNAVAGVDIGWKDAQKIISSAKTSPVLVAVIDSGIDLNHKDLQGRISSDGYDFLKNSANIIDTMGHGTHVSGIIAANSGNGIGIAGIAPDSVKILPLRVLSGDYQNFVYKGKLISDYVAEAVRYAVAHHASIINMSLGWPQVVDTANARRAIQEAVQSGVLVIASAGNDRKDQPTFPCSYEGVLCVGAISNNGQIARYSNSGGMVDLLAPGDSIISTFPMTLEPEILRIQGYEVMTGTSQAAPHVTAIAATLKSIYPELSASEIKVRLLNSSKPVATESTALYGAVDMARTLQAQPQPVFLPQFKTINRLLVDEKTLEVSDFLKIENLGTKANNVSISLTVNGEPAGISAFEGIEEGQSISVPLKYRFQNLGETSSVQIKVEVKANGMPPKTFSAVIPAVRAADQIQPRQIVDVQNVAGWIATINGHLFSRLQSVSTYGHGWGMPAFYQQTSSGTEGVKALIFDPSAATSPVAEITVPGIQRITQILRIDVQGNGSLSWLITGLGTEKKQDYFQFYFLNSDFKPLWGKQENSRWLLPLNNLLSTLGIRNYALPGSWIRNGSGLLVPSFLVSGQLPEGDGYDMLDPRHYRNAPHLYYLEPQTDQKNANGPLQLRLRALDGAEFRKKNRNLTLLATLPSSHQDLISGHLRVLVSNGFDLDSEISLWDIRSTTEQSVEKFGSWNILAASARAIGVLSAAESQNVGAMLGFFDGQRASLAWVGNNGALRDETEFKFESLANPFANFLGAFDLGASGRVWFVESRFDLVAYHQERNRNQNPHMQTLPIERDSSFQDSQFSQMFTPVVVGSQEHPKAGIFIDSTLVRGDQTAIAVWDPEREAFDKPLAYSFEIPSGCVQMNPTKISDRVESLSLPLLCQTKEGYQLRLVPIK